MRFTKDLQAHDHRAGAADAGRTDWKFWRRKRLIKAMTEDYSGNLVHAKAYLHEAEECMRKKDYEKGLMFLKMTDDEVRQAIAWVDRELYPSAVDYHPV